MKVMFGNKEVDYDSKKNALQSAQDNYISIAADCGGKEKCAKCKIKILSGAANPLTDAEKKLLTEEEITQNIRLACCTYFYSDSSVEIAEEQNEDKRKAGMIQNQVLKEADNGICKYFVEIEEASLECQECDITRLEKALNKNYHKTALKYDNYAVRQLSNVLCKGQTNVTVTISEDTVIDIEAGNTVQQKYGIAFDIGTTSVVAMLWDLTNGSFLKAKAMANPQAIYGADVISRINYCGEKEGNLRVLQKTIIQGLNKLMKEISEECHVNATNIYKCTVVGNTTMSHLFMNVNPQRIARAPFIPAFIDEIETLAEEMELCIHPKAKVYLLPNIASHVGSDISAGILSSKLYKAQDTTILIDVGTNGEIVLAHKGKMYACSTAAGPAFEGAMIHDGMRAGAGAIEKVKIENGNVDIQVIDGCAAKGLCGSGLIDAVAQLIKAGIINKKGKLMSQKEAIATSQPQNIVKRLRKREFGNEFVLAEETTDGKSVVLTQKDIREVQLAKGAIYAGIKTMLKQVQCELQDIDHFLIAGAFGSYIDVKNAVIMGLFPEIELEKMHFIGNSAGDGASIALLSNRKRTLMKDFTKGIQHVELSSNMDFQTLYMESMGF